MSNMYTYSVPFTSDQLFDDYCNQKMSQIEIAVKYGVTQKVIWRAMQKAGIPTRVAAKRDQTGEKNTSWKGGRTLQAAHAGETRFSDAGYWYVRKPDHPNATKSGYVAEHIVVASEKIGRPLEPGECVHHIDRNKQNNSPDNLAICTRSQHRKYHIDLEAIAIELYRKGLVKFDVEKGYYLDEQGDA